MKKIDNLKKRFADKLNHKVIKNIRGLLKNSDSYSSEFEQITKGELIDKLRGTREEATKADKMFKLMEETERLQGNRKTRQIRR